LGATHTPKSIFTKPKFRFGEISEVKVIKKGTNGNVLTNSCYGFVMIKLNQDIEEVSSYFVKTNRRWHVSLAREVIFFA
jgi:hypothetical protein